MRLSVRTCIVRLRTASLAEVLYRLKQVLVVWLAKHLSRALETCPVAVDPEHVRRLAMPSLYSEAGREELDAILSGRTFEPGAEVSAIRRAVSNVDGGGSSNDVRARWEPARLQHVTVLFAAVAAAPESSDSQPLREFARNAVIEWIAENPVLYGPHYVSAMECGLRIPVFFYALKLSDCTSSEHAIICGAIYRHAWWISRRLSLYSSLGNHTICECVGLIFAGAIFGNDWLEQGLRLLRKELPHQVLDDGGPAEQAFGYHRFVLDLYWLAVDFIEKNEFCDCTDLKKRLLAGEDFLATFQGSNGNWPAVGDDDGGFALGPGLRPNRQKPERRSAERRRVFKSSGYTVVRMRDGFLFTFDHGPLGMPPLFNHGHADALSFTLHRDGEPILVDPGTYRYNGAPRFRRYFKGTRAHNTVTIDGQDQAVQETGFIWSRPFTAKLIDAGETGEGVFADAVHDGYSRLPSGPVYHRRSIRIPGGRHLVCVDRFYGSGSHDFELNFHLHPAVRVGRDRDWWVVEKGASKIFVKLCGNGDFSRVEGREEPPFGWYSPSYGLKRQSVVLTSLRSGQPRDVFFVTLICTEEIPDNFETGALKCTEIPA